MRKTSMSQRNRGRTEKDMRKAHMTTVSTPPAIDAVALQAVRLGRQLAAAWSDAAVETDATLDQQINATLARCAAGAVFDDANDRAFALMLAAISQTLDGFSPGYGRFFQRECTARNPFCDVEQDRVRRLGELLKGLVDARNAVVDAVIAERELARLRRR
nr:hypothetical protein [Paracoccus saliphilus]